jgi:hypothetical protein
MQIITKTSTRLHLHDKLSNYFIAGIVLFACSWSMVAITELLRAKSWMDHLSVIIPCAVGFGSWVMLFMIPVQADWKLESDSDELTGGQNRSTGKIYIMFQGLIWKRHTQHEFGDVIRVGTEIAYGKGISNTPYHIGLKLRSGKILKLNLLGLDEADWREVTEAISFILQIAVPKLPKTQRHQR